MEHADQQLQGVQPEGDRLSRLSRASSCITETLDLDTVLQGVVDGARLLTGARNAGVTVLEDGGQSPVFITSGMTPEERRLRFELPGEREFFEHLSSLAEPLRVADFSGYARELGLPEIGPPLGPVGAFLGSPVQHLGRRVGNIYLSAKEGGAGFTPEDEAVLTLFTSQAALAIANARRHREEQRARAGLETLMDTSPVGVVVFDMKTGASVSFNPEARRIVDVLRNPHQSPEDLLGLITVRRVDRSEVSLEEFPLAQVLNSTETVRAEEIVLEASNGRSVTVLLNATPIRSGEGEVESVMVTMQDMTAVEEQERLRAEFLAMVSHELRMPLTTIIGATTTLLNATADLDPVESR